MYKTRMLGTIIPFLWQSEVDLGISFGEGDFETFPAEDVYNEFNKYLTFSILYPSYLDDNQGQYYFQRTWSDYCSHRAEDAHRALSALYGDYNPLYNYDLHEQETQGAKDGGETGKDEQKNSVGVWDADKQEEENPSNRTTTHKNYTNGFNDSSDNGSPDSRTVTTETGKVTVTTSPKQRANAADMAGTESALTSGSFNSVNQQHNLHETGRTPKNDQTLSAIADNEDTTTQYNRTNDRYLTRNGNIGVMTTESLIQEELELRLHDFLEEFVKRYIHEYCVLTPNYEEGDNYGTLY